MAFTRTQMVAAVAGTLSLAALTGCPASTPGAVGPSAGASASAMPSSGTSAMPSAGTSAMPSAGASTGASNAPTTAPSGTTGSASPNPTVSASAPAPSGKVVIVSGNVYDEEGATVDGALVTVKSLDASVPYSATATTSQGSWVVNNVPEGANVEVVSTKDGWTTRRRVGSFQLQATGKPNKVNFGAPGGSSNDNNNDEDPTGESYFISDYPEVASTEPVTDATGVDNSKLTFKLRLSEALDEDSRDNLVEALTIVPANEDAAGEDAGNDPVDFETREDSDVSDGTADAINGAIFDLTDGGAAPNRAGTLTSFNYTIEEGSTFLGNSDRDVSATWNAEGTELTFSFDATLIASENDEAKYQAVLVSQGQGSDDVIEDEDGNQLGTNANGDLRDYPEEGRIIANVFKETDLATKDNAAQVVADPDNLITDRAIVNWASTHDSAVNWEIKRDETDPKLTGVDVSKDVDGDFRIELTFSEGMAAYNGSSQGDSDLANMRRLEQNFKFVLGDKVGDTEDIDLSDDDDTILLDPRAADVNPDRSGPQTTFGDSTDVEDEFTFLNAAVQINNPEEDAGSDTDVSNVDDADFTTGEIFVEVDDDSPNTVFIWIKGKANFFSNTASEIKAYVDTVEDPAGNAISDNDAEDNQVRGTI